MSDTNPFASALSGFFFGNDKNDPRVNPQLRQRIALAMMAGSKRPYPKNLGEGLSAIGEAIGERGQMKALMDADIAQQGINPPPAAGAGPRQMSSLAPSDGSVEADTSTPQTIPPPAPPPAPVPSQAPGRGFTPVSMQPGAGELIDPGEYNVVDAADPRNRYKPAPAYLQPALERNIRDPERRGYLGQLAGKEAQTPGEVSPTGAAGPFQFTQDTGAKYGIPGNARFDPDASTRAVNAFTDDNVKTLTARLGREPTPGEMALAHQQGRGTAANMLTGTGNASDYNLSVNKVAPGTSPQAAVNKIMGYYGMPGSGVTTPGPRDVVAAALLAQQQPQPSQLSVADYGQPRALAATPPDSLPPEIATGASAITAAPQPPSGIRAAPPQQVAQAQPQAVPGGYVPPEVKDPTGAPIIGMKPREAELTNWLKAEIARGNPYAQAKADAAGLSDLQNERAILQNAANEKYKADLTRNTAQIAERNKALVGRDKNIADVALGQEAVKEAQSKNQLRAQFANMDPDTVFKTMTTSSQVASSAAKSLAASQAAIQALNAGAITGSGADAKLDIAKLLHGMGLPDKGNVIANTETFRGAMQPVVASIMHQTSGTSQLSEGELRFAANAAAGDIKLDANSIRQLTTIIDKASRGVIADHQKKLDVLFPDNEKAKALFGVEQPKPPAPSAGTPDGTTATGPNGAKMVRRNGKWEPM